MCLYSLSLVLIDLRIPLVIHGLVHNFCFFWDSCLINIGASLLQTSTRVVSRRASGLYLKNAGLFFLNFFGLVLSLVSVISMIFVFVTECTITERIYSWLINS